MTDQIRLANMSRKCWHNEKFAPDFALIYIDRDGNLGHEISPSLYDSREDILSAEVTERFLKAVAESGVGYHASRPATHPFLQSHAPCNANFRKLRKAEGNRDTIYKSVAQECFTQPAPAGPKTTLQCRERVGIHDLNTGPYLALIPINDSTLLRRYYEKVFQNLQQTNCRVIAKAYVKVVEPRKQLQYPYNGRKTVAGITRQMSPEDTKPPWWPPGVSHREPDHLLKAGR